jgi:ABC-type phosphate transport system ATPase subunit
MKKLLVHLFILAIIRDEKKAQMIVDIIYDKTPVIDKDEQVVAIRGKVSNVMVQPNDKRKEVLDAIQFLKNKDNKTKADKEKIQMLEVILKSV